MENGPPRFDDIELPVDAIIGDRYQVVRLIARGGMGEVYLGRHTRLNRHVAIKILKPPPDAEDPQSFEDRFRLEAETLATLDHPNIVTLHDFGETLDGRYWLAMEYVDGPRLSDLLKNGPMPTTHAIALLLQVCAALRYAHKRGVVHRDLKPSNLLVRTNEGGEQTVKVVDFGLVKLTGDDQTITRAGLILGSPHCMAPEQVKGVEVDHRADLYAIGVLLFRCITGHYPFHGQNSTATMVAHLNQPIPSFHSLAPTVPVPKGLEPIVRRCLAKEPRDRYPDMGALMWDLAQVANLSADQYMSLSLTASTVQRQVVPPAAKAGMGLALAFSVVTLALGAGAVLAGGLLFWQSQRSVAATSPDTVVIQSAPLPAAPRPEADVEPKALPEGAETTGASGSAPPAEPTPSASAKPSKPTKPQGAAPKPEGTDPKKPAPTDAPKDDAPAGYMGVPDDW